MIRLTKYRDVAAAFRDPRLIHERHRIQGTPPPAVPPAFAKSSLMRYASKFMVSMDPPDHTRLRGLVSKAFTPTVITALRGTLERLAAESLSFESAEPQRLDLVAFAQSYSITVIAKMLGLEIEDSSEFADWSHALSATIESPTPEVVLKAAAASDKLSVCLLKTIESKRQSPQQDLISELIAADLTEDELVATCMLILVAGNETTANLISSGTYTLLCHEEQLALLRANTAERLPNAIEEILRFEPPGRIAVRWASEDLMIGDVSIAQGDRVELDVAAANRDPEVFANPDLFDITRDFSRHQHLTFGGGIHYCIGAPLARMETQIVLSTLLQTYPTIKLATDRIEWQDRPSIRGLKELMVTLTRR